MKNINTSFLLFSITKTKLSISAHFFYFNKCVMGIFLLRTDKLKLSVVCETTHSEFDVLLSPPLKVPPFKNSPPLSEYTVFPHMASSSSGKDPGLSSQ